MGDCERVDCETAACGEDEKPVYPLGSCCPKCVPEESDYNCYTKEIWTDAKKKWCCDNKKIGCSEESDYNCKTREIWTDAKKKWCCEKEKLGCSDDTEKPNTKVNLEMKVMFQGSSLSDDDKEKLKSGLDRVISHILTQSKIDRKYAKIDIEITLETRNRRLLEIYVKVNVAVSFVNEDDGGGSSLASVFMSNFEETEGTSTFQRQLLDEVPGITVENVVSSSVTIDGTSPNDTSTKSPKVINIESTSPTEFEYISSGTVVIPGLIALSLLQTLVLHL